MTQPEHTFSVDFPGARRLEFSSCTHGLIANGREYVAGADGILVYDKVNGVTAQAATCQYSTNTSTLIPAFRVLGLPYHPYFDERDVVESQNNISFYWNPSRLAAFYNRYSTDTVDIDAREPIIRSAVEFLIQTADGPEDFLPEESLAALQQPCVLLGFYEGFPIFDANQGLPYLLCRLGIHVGPDSIMISTPMDKYAGDVEQLAGQLEKRVGVQARYKKNRVMFERTDELISELGIGTGTFSGPLAGSDSQ
jgi:hypothetical protein